MRAFEHDALRLASLARRMAELRQAFVLRIVARGDVLQSQKPFTAKTRNIFGAVLCAFFAFFAPLR
jgi:hypothetical protein